MAVGIAIALLWLLMAGQLQTQESVAAVAAGLAAGVFSAWLRKRTGRTARHGWRTRNLWLRHAPGVAWRAVLDCWPLTCALYRRLATGQSRGTFTRIAFDVGSDGVEESDRRVLATVATTIQPNSYVVAFNRSRNEVLVHQLEPTPEAPIADSIRRVS
jgi:multisubunit Na+/H+ antiporter MnhE subunit